MSTSSTSTISLTSNGSGSLSSLGIGTGLNVNSIISSLVAVDQVPLTGLQTQASLVNAQISAVGQIQSLLATLQSSATALAHNSTWNTMSVSSSISSAVSATASTTSPPNAGAFAVQVQSLAQGESGVTSAVPTANTVGAGTLTIQLGTFSNTTASPPTFTAASSSPISISVAAGSSLTSVATQINNAGAGVTATVVNGTSGQQLLLQSSSTGAAQGFTMQATDSGTLATGQTALSTLAFDPSQSQYGQGSSTVQYGADAQATINGVAVSSSTNTLSSAIAGMSFTLNAVTTSPVVITATQNVSNVVSDVSSFVSAYNAVNDLINTDTAYNAATSTSGVLQGDAGTIGLQNALARLVGTQIGGIGSAYGSLAALGISVGSGGDLSINNSTLANALSTNPAAVQSFFTGSTGTTDSAITSSSTGLAAQFSSFLTQVTGTSGSVTEELAGLNSQLTANTSAQASVNAQASALQAQLTAQYTALDAQMASISSLSSYMTQQIAQWNSSSNSSSG